MYLWVKSIAYPKGAKKEIHTDPKSSVCYVMKEKSFLDLLVLDYHCCKEGLPRPIFKTKQLSEEICASHTHLKKQSIISDPPTRDDYQNIYGLYKQNFDSNIPIQIVPVSIYWGRNPGKKEKSLFKLLFLEDGSRNFFQRFFSFFAHGRKVCCCFGEAVNLKTAQRRQDLDKFSIELKKDLLEHFHEKKIAVLGPQIYNRNQVMRDVLRSDSVREAIQKEADHKKIDTEKAKRTAYKYVNEIAANLSFNMLRFYNVFLTWLCNRLYRKVKVYNFESIRPLTEQHEIIYLPCHRSHMDYLILNFNLYRQGVSAPHTAAGVNLNFWPIGSMLKGGGAFFIRRSIRGNYLYREVYNEYVNYLMQNRYSICFYPEGGRSRTGKLLPPKQGMLSMTLQNSLKSNKKVYIVPIYIGYDKMMEGISYLKELRGHKKKRESLKQLVQAPKVLKKGTSNAYINFGEPLEINVSSADKESIKRETKEVSMKVMERINSACVATPVALFTLALLSTPNRALAEEELISLVEIWRDLLKMYPYSSSTVIAKENIAQSLAYAEGISTISRFKHPAGDVIHIDEKDRDLLTYYRNNIVHLFALPSLIASFFSNHDSCPPQELFETCKAFYPVLKQEYFLKWDNDEIDKALKDTAKSLVMKELLYWDHDSAKITRPSLANPQSSYTLILGNIIGEEIKQYSLLVCILYQYSLNGVITLEDYKKECSLLSRKLIILGSLRDYKNLNDSWYNDFIKFLTSNGYIKISNHEIHRQERFKALAEAAIKFLGNEAYQSIIRTTQESPKKH